MESHRLRKDATHPPDRPPGQTGASLLFVIALLVIGAGLAAAVALLASASVQTDLTNNRLARARYLALSGQNMWAAGTTGTFTIGGDTITLSQSGPDDSNTYTVTSRGTVNPGTAIEANARIEAKRYLSSPISFSSDLSDFSTPTVGKTVNSGNAINVYAIDTTDASSGGDRRFRAPAAGYASGWLRFGAGATDTNGAIWYTGSRGTCSGGVCPDGMCQSGQCGFGKGLRAYFGFVFSKVDTSPTSTDDGDGFTFAVATASANDPATAAGGPATDSRGEYLGYAGPGPSGVGIAPPKLALEVDVYPNRSTASPEKADSRSDASNANHIAVVYWGGSSVYDDNVHGAGVSPANPAGPSATNVGYYEQAKQSGKANWLEDGNEHTLRLEILRTGTENGGTYEIKAWIDGSGSAFADVTKDYTAATPLVDFTTTLSASDHAKLGNIYFGWTEGTGRSPQDVAVHDFALDFRR